MSKLKAKVTEALTTVMETVAKFTPDHAEDPLQEKAGFIGKPISRVDGRLKVTGGAKYTAEHQIDQLTYAAPVHSTIAKGTITHISTEAALRVPGVLTVMTHLNAPKMKAPKNAYIVSLANPLAGPSTTLPVMQSSEIFWNGQVVALVVAETPEAAAFAAALVEVGYQLGNPALSFTTGKPNAQIPDNVALQPSELKIGDAEGELKISAVIVDETYHTAKENQNAMEPHATIAIWEGDTYLKIYDSTQYPVGAKETLMEVFGLKGENVRVITTFVGGGFGAKAAIWSNVPLAAAAAKLTGRPVKYTLPRASVNYTVGGRTLTEQRVALGATTDGKLTSLIHTGYTTCTKDVFAEQFSLIARHMYVVPNVNIWQKTVRLDMVQNSFKRAPGESPGSFALESAMDELAWKLNMDPITLRMLNEPEKDPTHGMPFSSRYLREAFTLGAGKFGWDPKRAEPGSVRNGDWLIGTGTASALYPTQLLPATVRTRISADGTVRVSTASIEMGVGVATIQSQHIAERFGVPLEKVQYVFGDTDLPESRAMAGSAATAALGSAIQQSAIQLTKELLKLTKKTKGSVLKKAKADDVEIRAGGLYLKQQPEVGQTFEVILSSHELPFLEVTTPSAQNMDAMKYSMASYGAHFCEVHVHAITCQVKVKRFVSAFDCGRIINPKTSTSQLKGAIIMGIGMALMEETLIDERTGRLMNPTLSEYHMPIHADIPEIDIYFIDLPDPLMPLGAKSVGEIGITGSAAAIANAIYQATGKRIRSLPITLDKLL